MNISPFAVGIGGPFSAFRCVPLPVVCLGGLFARELQAPVLASGVRDLISSSPCCPSLPSNAPVLASGDGYFPSSVIAQLTPPHGQAVGLPRVSDAPSH